MSQKIYLCRHASYTNLKNQKLTEQGKRNSKELGEYLRQFVPPESAFFITSTQPRTIYTAEIVAGYMGTPLKKGNHCAVFDLCEVQLRDDVGEAGLLGMFSKSELKRLPTSEKIAKIVSRNFVKIGDKHPDKSLIAILHGNVNCAFLYQAYNKEKSLENYRMSHCALWELERNGTEIVPLEQRFGPAD